MVCNIYVCQCARRRINGYDAKLQISGPDLESNQITNTWRGIITMQVRGGVDSHAPSAGGFEKATSGSSYLVN